MSEKEKPEDPLLALAEQVRALEKRVDTDHQSLLTTRRTLSEHQKITAKRMDSLALLVDRCSKKIEWFGTSLQSLATRYQKNERRVDEAMKRMDSLLPPPAPLPPNESVSIAGRRF